jgi:hypothetical protein
MQSSPVLKGLARQLWTNWFDGSWHYFYSLGGTLPSAGGSYASPALASWGANRVDIFFRGADNTLWQKAWTGSSWSAFYSLGSVVSADVAAVSKANPNTIDIMTSAADHGALGLWWKRYPFTRPCYFEQPGACGVCGE